MCEMQVNPINENSFKGIKLFRNRELKEDLTYTRAKFQKAPNVRKGELT